MSAKQRCGRGWKGNRGGRSFGRTKHAGGTGSGSTRSKTLLAGVGLDQRGQRQVLACHRRSSGLSALGVVLLDGKEDALDVALVDAPAVARHRHARRHHLRQRRMRASPALLHHRVDHQR
eukprot:143025-Rhodomonas_salina.1